MNESIRTIGTYSYLLTSSDLIMTTKRMLVLGSCQLLVDPSRRLLGMSCTYTTHLGIINLSAHSIASARYVPYIVLEDNQVALATMTPEYVRIVHELRLARGGVVLDRGRRLGGSGLHDRRQTSGLDGGRAELRGRRDLAVYAGFKHAQAHAALVLRLGREALERRRGGRRREVRRLVRVERRAAEVVRKVDRPARRARGHWRALRRARRRAQVRELVLERGDVLLQRVRVRLRLEHGRLERAHVRLHRGELERVLLLDRAEHLLVERVGLRGYRRGRRDAELLELLVFRGELGAEGLHLVLGVLEELLCFLLGVLPLIELALQAGDLLHVLLQRRLELVQLTQMALGHLVVVVALGLEVTDDCTGGI
ncbi:uncharacterized protein C8Q71DRAFT_595742 [Rhodofomes roseus]|uniref:Uncharacterized protein n=1 Tax=Rhodofomes roseus TaxID=34475 RepID=A0ABQ8KHG7_9APHY|nr:uncharacterized protein C8Q71DRAFT_595742 [Rhodofomes roseus]KAH9837309.1 hypothetical protein C8Q71DRAFT_595742 [Rhodofomes roseus]